MRNQKKINKKISLSMKKAYREGNIPTLHFFRKGVDNRRHRFTEGDRQKAIFISNEKRFNKYKYLLYSVPFEKYSKKLRYHLLYLQQNGNCFSCRVGRWNSQLLIFEIHHIDGNNKNNIRENVILLCPNCHSQTENFRNLKNGKSKLLDKDFLEFLLRIL